MSIKDWATGGVVTLLIGGSAFTFSQTDIANNLAEDTGMTQEQAQQYVESVTEDQLVSFDEMASDLRSEGNELLGVSRSIDCTNYDYEWVSPSLSCYEGKRQLEKLAQDTTSLGHAYDRLGSESASRDDLVEAIRLIDQLNADYQFEIVSFMLDGYTINEMRNTNSYNKAVFQSALESE